MKSNEAQRKLQARIGGGTAFISDDFIDKFKATGSGVTYGDYLQDKDDMDSVVDTDKGDGSSLNLKALSDAYKDYDYEAGDEGSTREFLAKYLQDPENFDF